MVFRATFIRAEKRVHILTCFHLLLKKAVKYKKEALEIGTYTIQRFREAVLHVGKYCIEESTLRGNLPACAEGQARTDVIHRMVRGTRGRIL